MKKHVVYLMVILFTTIISGCYTVIWMPEDEFPSKNKSTIYYDETYYGDYYSFYGYPWWLRFSPPTEPIGNKYNRNSNESTSVIRNEGSGRSYDNGRTILPTNPPSRDGSNNSGSTGSTNTNSSNNGNSSSVNSNSNSGNRSSDNNSIRNNDGSRNTDQGRK